MLGLLIIVCINVPCLKNKKERKTPQLSTNESLKGNAKRNFEPQGPKNASTDDMQSTY